MVSMPKKETGLHETGFRKCADQPCVTEIREDLAIELIYQGPPLTEILHDDETLLTI